MEAGLERAYPYRTSWWVVGCGALMFGILGGGAAAMIPFGWQQLQAGRMPIGVAMMVAGVFGAPMFFLALFSVAAGIRNTISPPLLRVTPTALLLPKTLRGSTETLDEDNPEPAPDMPQPEEVPFTAIRWARREGPINPGSHKLLIVHDLSKETLVVEQAMMRPSDFDELETVLRAAIPAAFAPAPPPPPSQIQL
jgi:hypothetical protein